MDISKLSSAVVYIAFILHQTFGIHILNCHDEHTDILKFVHNDETPKFRCFGSGNPNATFVWSFVNGSGMLLVLSKQNNFDELHCRLIDYNQTNA